MAPPSSFLRPRVQNVVATCTCGTALYLTGIARTLRYAEYNPRRFSAVAVRLRTPRSTALVFSSGKIVCTGTKSAWAARWALLKFVALLRDRCHVDRAHVYTFRIQNMVASVDAGFPVALARLRRLYPREASYEPALFPGLVYRAHATHGVVALVFASGRLVLTGAKHVDELDRAFETFWPILYTAHARYGDGDGDGDDEPTTTTTTTTTTVETLLASLANEGLLDVPATPLCGGTEPF